MDLGNAVNWIQLAIWIFAVALWVGRILRGEVSMHPWLEKALSSNWVIGAVVILGLIVSLVSLSQKPKRIIAGSVPTGFAFTQENFVPADSRWHSGLRVSIVPEKSFSNAVQMLVICDGGIGLAPKTGTTPTDGRFEVEDQMLMPSHPDVWNVKWRMPLWTPDNPVTFELLSQEDIHVKWVAPISYNPNRY